MKKPRNLGISSTWIIVGIVIIAAIVGGTYFVYQTRTGGEAKFQVMNLNLSTEKANVGETVTSEVKVSNVGGEKGTYAVTLKIDGSPYKRKKVTLESNESATVSFEFEKQETGTFTVSAGEISRTLEIKQVEKGKVLIEDLSVTPKEVKAGEPVTVSVQIKNPGETEASRTLELKINGSPEKRKEVTLKPGEESLIDFTLQKEAERTYSIKLGDYTESLEVTGPIEESGHEMQGGVIAPSPGKTYVKGDVTKDNEFGTEIEEAVVKIIKKGTVLEKIETDSNGDYYSSGLDVQDGEKLLIKINHEDFESEQKTITVDIHQGIYTVNFELTPTPETAGTVSAQSLTLSSEEVEPGETVTVFVKVQNTGNTEISETLDLEVNGTVEKSKNVILEGGQSKIITFKIRKNTVDTYNVTVRKLSTTFQVKSSTPQKQKPKVIDFFPDEGKSILELKIRGKEIKSRSFPELGIDYIPETVKIWGSHFTVWGYRYLNSNDAQKYPKSLKEDYQQTNDNKIFIEDINIGKWSGFMLKKSGTSEGAVYYTVVYHDEYNIYVGITQEISYPKEKSKSIARELVEWYNEAL